MVTPFVQSNPSGISPSTFVKIVTEGCQITPEEETMNFISPISRRDKGGQLTVFYFLRSTLLFNGPFNVRDVFTLRKIQTSGTYLHDDENTFSVVNGFRGDQFDLN